MRRIRMLQQSTALWIRKYLRSSMHCAMVVPISNSPNRRWAQPQLPCNNKFLALLIPHSKTSSTCLRVPLSPTPPIVAQVSPRHQWPPFNNRGLDHCRMPHETMKHLSTESPQQHSKGRKNECTATNHSPKSCLDCCWTWSVWIARMWHPLSTTELASKSSRCPFLKVTYFPSTFGMGNYRRSRGSWGSMDSQGPKRKGSTAK
mmetsp:Transcript_24179/g.67040  ORF Transcript_24179/g.67040 Transcript_24179/m.67040 type:complete len:203 (+) Transcript_24179:773-1381(+)